MSGEHLSKVRGVGTRDEPLRTSAWKATRHATIPKKSWHTKQKLPTPLSLLFFPVIRPKTSSVSDCCYERRWLSVPRVFLIGSLSKDDGNGNENGKKAIGLDWQNKNSARVSRFFVHSLAFVAPLRRKSAYFHLLSRTCTQENYFLFLFLNFDTVFQNSPLEKFASICRIKRDGITPIKFEVAPIHFLKDVFVAMVVAWAP